MDEKEKRLLEEIEASCQETEIPEGLKPEEMEKRLEAVSEEMRKETKHTGLIGKYAVVAAAAILVVGLAGTGIWKLNLGTKTADQVKEQAKVSIEELEDQKASAKVETAKNYEEVYNEMLGDQSDSDKESTSSSASTADSAVDSDFGVSANGSQEIATLEGGAASNGTDKAVASGAGYLDTNTREEEVGEADIVKTDGNYLYILYGNKIRILDIRNPEMEELGMIRIGGNTDPVELYVKDDRLVVFYNETVQKNSDQAEDSSAYGADYQSYTVAETYDLSDRREPVSLGSVQLGGYYRTVRISGDYIYLFSDYYADYNANRKVAESYIPTVQGKTIASNCIFLPGTIGTNQFLVVGSFSLKDPTQIIDSKAILSNGGDCYVSEDNIYVYEYVYDEKEDYDQTLIRKISYKEGKLKGVAQTKIWGQVKDSFCIDEYDGNLRLVTTVNPVYHYGKDGGIELYDASVEENGSSNALYILDKKLNVTGKIEKLAPNEEVYSARFMGKTAYFVTYEQVDPLFSADLSDPQNPKILGALKIPGFSDYLHGYGEGRLLGIGMETDEAGAQDGVKLSLFDISDPTDVTEVQKTVLEGFYATDLSYNYKLAAIDSKQNLIGFSAYGDGTHYFIYRYDEKEGFVCVLDKEVNSYGSEIRGLYAGNRFYLVQGNAVESFDLNTFDKIDDIVL
ncbi:hypothetical protein KGMB01110_12980 [Mediterraneibacter butyricigenes]|uniref:Beta propeller domain-containing protein n=1 Tax=Mediterraneibacter butyricigenes TaxID=2316025 RepID=A0A391PJJ4_9FIRM|nr:beta-propeller domain-containing protein [Mediterraneibacter butyricigenes]GCA66862.1 hypothetical protein KGMB01110_12980 [Mediterraneibacter butyricigenes]